MLVGALIVVTAQRRAHRRRVPGNNPNEEGTMTDKNIVQAKGRVKEAAGAVTGDQRLKSEGHADQAKGSEPSWV